MERGELKELLEQVANGAVTPDDAAARLDRVPVEELGYAALDMQCASRQGTGEVVYGDGKTAEQIAGICDRLVDAGQPRVLVTRLDAEKARATRNLMTHAEAFEFYKDARGRGGRHARAGRRRRCRCRLCGHERCARA